MSYQDKLETVTQELFDLTERLSAVNERNMALLERFKELQDDMAELKKEVSDIHQMANRWKGGFIVLAGLGGFIGWVMASWDGIMSFMDFFRQHHK